VTLHVTPQHQAKHRLLPHYRHQPWRFPRHEGLFEKMNRIWSSSSAAQLDILLQIAENSLRVTDLAETDLQWVKPEWAAVQTLGWMQDQGFDAAPIDDPEPYRVVVARSLRPIDQPVYLQAQPLDASLLVSSDLSLADGISRLKRQQFYFVLQRDQLQGIVTRADLQRPAVSMIIFSLILASETAMREITSRNLASVWFEKIRPAAKMDVEKVYNNRVKTNTEVTKLDCLMIHDLLALMNECTGIVAQLGFTKSQFKKWKERLRLLRDTLAHGGGLLHAEPDPMRAVELFDEVRGFAEKTTRLIAAQTTET
jgi:hypothetical protein